MVASHLGHFFARGVMRPSTSPSRPSISMIFFFSCSSVRPLVSRSSSNIAWEMRAS